MINLFIKTLFMMVRPYSYSKRELAIVSKRKYACVLLFILIMVHFRCSHVVFLLCLLYIFIHQRPYFFIFVIFSHKSLPYFLRKLSIQNIYNTK